MRRNLVIVRAGNTSLHPAWLNVNRNWDIIVNYFGDEPSVYLQNDVKRIDSKGPKWPALHELIQQIGPEIASYDYVCFPDDDLAFTPDALDTFFALAKHHQLDLCQPALTHDSHIGVNVTAVNNRFLLRYTNFVEIMAPCFSQTFLQQSWSSFNTNLTGWGLDFVWPKRAPDPRKVAIIDAVTMIHTRPLGGPNYAWIEKHGIDPEKELNDLLSRENIKRHAMIYGGILRHNGQEVTIWNKGHNELIRNIIGGYLPGYMNFPDILYMMIEPILQSLDGWTPRLDISPTHAK